MADIPQAMEHIQVEEASLSDVVSLSTIVPRAFFPTSSFHRQAWPDTPKVRAWWSRIFVKEIDSTDCHVIAALNSKATDDIRVVGFLTMRLLEADDRTAGLLSLEEFTDDHDTTLLRTAKDDWVESRSKVFANTGQKHYLLELLGVDHDYKGRGLGKQILRMACDIADGTGYPIFVDANSAAAAFYLQFGFTKIDPGQPSSVSDTHGHTSCQLVRQPYQ